MSKWVTKERVLDQGFFLVPKALLRGQYAHLNSDARLIFALLLDRLELSAKNGWLNSKGEVYCKYSQADLGEAIGVKSEKTVRSAIKKLIKAGLVKEEILGIGRTKNFFVADLGILPAHSRVLRLAEGKPPEEKPQKRKGKNYEHESKARDVAEAAERKRWKGNDDPEMEALTP